MSLFDALIDKLVARVVAESAAGDAAQAKPLPPLESPYVCAPTRWGETDEKPEAPSPEPASSDPRKPRRISLAVHREPSPRGLLTT